MKDVIKAKSLSSLHCYGELEMKRNQFRIYAEMSKGGYKV